MQTLYRRNLNHDKYVILCNKFVTYVTKRLQQFIKKEYTRGK